MGAKRTAWHVLFGRLLVESAPPWVVVRPEVPLGAEPQRMDFVLLRRRGKTTDDLGKRLHGLWRWLGVDTLVEFKSVRRPYGGRDMDRLVGYGHQWFVATPGRLRKREDLVLALVVPSKSPALQRAVEDLGCAWEALEPGCWRLTGGAFPMVVVALDTVADSEHDALVQSFADGVVTRAAWPWWNGQVGTMKATKTRKPKGELEDMDDVVARMLASFTPAERVAGLAPAERVAGLAPADVLLTLPDDMLAALPESYLATLPEAARRAIRRRLGHGHGH